MRNVIVVATLASSLIACARKAPEPIAATGDSTAASTKIVDSEPSSSSTEETPSPIVLGRICQAEYVGKDSEIFVGRDAAGKVVRYSVTPSGIVDLGNLYFDTDGKFLGIGEGGEEPWGDKAAMAKIEAREKELSLEAKFEASPAKCGKGQ